MNENYKNWSWVWNGKPVDGGGIEKYPEWAKDYHSIYDPRTNSLRVNEDPTNDERTAALWDEGGTWDTLQALAEEAPSGQAILEAGIDIITLLLKKNLAYGNSAIEPLRLFSNATTEEQILVRVDDKLSRLKNNQTYPGDNDVDDLIGYLILLKVVRRKSEG